MSQQNEKQNVLVFSGATYPAMQIIDCLKNSLRFHVIAGGSYPNHSEFVCDDVITDIPFINNKNFLTYFKNLLKERNIKFVIPTDDDIALLLSAHQDELSATIVCSSYETAKLCRHKQQTYQKLDGASYLPTVYKTSEIDMITQYPIFVKPDANQGSRGARKINSIEELRVIENLEDMVVTEYLPGDEYTVDCFTNKEGKLLYCNPRIRTRLMNGITARGTNVECSSEFQDIVNDINSKIRFRGYWFVQLKRSIDGNLKLMEICTRFAGSFGISKASGVNLPLLALCDFSGLPTEALANDYVVTADKTYIDRYKLDLHYDNVIIDFDDTITYKNGKAVNPYIIAFLYQCRERGKHISLITRHYATFNESLEDSFKRLNICNELFDEIVELKWNDKKWEKLQGITNAIFIDNSFAERKEVKEHCCIPVFDVCNIDCLFDWRS